MELRSPILNKNTTLNVSVIIDFGGDPSKCPLSCKVLPDRRCQCQDLGPFDVGRQIARVFQSSNIIYIKNISSVLQFQFWKTVSFWSVFLFTAWFIATLFILKFKVPKYDAMIYLEGFNKLKLRTVMFLSLKVSHPLAEIYTIPRHEGLSKTARALVFYTRNLLLFTFLWP